MLWDLELAWRSCARCQQVPEWVDPVLNRGTATRLLKGLHLSRERGRRGSATLEEGGNTGQGGVHISEMRSSRVASVRLGDAVVIRKACSGPDACLLVRAIEGRWWCVALGRDARV